MTSWFSRAAFAIALSPPFLFACTSSNGAKPNSSRCPAAAPAPTDGCSRGDVDGGDLSCVYPCDGKPGSMTLTCSPVGYPGGWSMGSSDCVTLAPAPNGFAPTTPSASAAATPSGPIECGDSTCASDEYCVHECCDFTPCSSLDEDGGCPGGRAVPAGGGQCAGECFVGPACSASTYCQKGTPSPDCVGTARQCNVGCD
jgi:hypothetical protein